MERSIDLFNVKDWQDAPEYPPGTKKKLLYEENGTRTLILKLPGGFRMEPHSHINAEQHVILQGEYRSDHHVYHQGAYRSFKAHEEHGPFESENGALIFVVWHSSQV